MKKADRINQIIDGYVTELKNNKVTSFYYNGKSVQIYRDELSENEYTLVDFIGDLICIRYDIDANWSNYEIQIAIKRAEEKCGTLPMNYEFLSSAIDSLYMMLENDE